MKVQLQQWMGPLKDQFAEQPRLRVGAWLVLGILALYGLLLLGDYREAREPEVQRLADRHARLERVIESGDWSERASQAQESREAMTARLWPADSRGVARAEFESWLRDQAEDAELENVSLDVRQLVPVEENPGLYRLSARLEANHDPIPLNVLLVRLALHDYRVGVESLSTRSRRPARTQMDLVTLFRIEEGSGS